MEMSKLLTLLIVLVSTASKQASSAPAPPPGLGRPFEKEENRSINALMTSMLGGVDEASKMDLADNGYILAELDMYLTEEQYLGLYEPPEPKDMAMMGMMSTILDTPMADDGEDYKVNDVYVRTKRKAIRDVRLRWTDAIIPYTFVRDDFDLKDKYMIQRAMTEWERYTCVNFRPAKQSDLNFVRFQNGSGCNSNVGMVGGVQVLNLEASVCRFKGTYLHEIGHALGLVHEHQRPDRDNYIEILYDNADPSMLPWFKKYTSSKVNTMGVPYDYASIMHYSITAFSKDGKSQTIRAKDAEKEKTIGKAYLKELAYSDVMIVNQMYKCSSHCSDPGRCGPDGHLDQNCNCICRDGSSDCDRTKRGINKNCKNLYNSWSCYTWANQGECQRNEYYMNQQCAKACGVCGSQEEDDSNKNCKDKFTKKKCEVWKARGDCVTNTRWMQVNCKATCDLCDDESSRPAVQCSNAYQEDLKCKEWTLGGECQVNGKSMFTNCRRSCWLCDKDDVDDGEDAGGIDEEELNCVNTNDKCEHWASIGECSKNPRYMIHNCRKACGKCDDGTCKNLHDDNKCEMLSQKLECIIKARWMGRHCAKSCRRGLCANVDGKSIRRTITKPPSTTRSTRGSRTRLTTRGTTPKTRDSTEPCGNKHRPDKECDVWAMNGQCHINPNFMLKYCSKACGLCIDGGDNGAERTTKATIDKVNCVNSNKNCEKYALSGECSKNPTWMIPNCRKACGKCDDGR